MKITPAQFIREVRQEISKVTWPSRKETMMTTVMVLIMAIIAAIFFLIADAVIFKLINFFLNVFA